MRILLLAPMLPRRDGPGAIPVLLHAELEALKQHHHVTLVTAIGDEPGEEEAAAALRAAGVEVCLADRRRPPPGLRRWQGRWRLASTWALRGWPWRTVWFAAPAVQRVLDELVATESFDLIAVEDSSMAMYRLPRGIPAVFTEHEVRRPRATAWRPGREQGVARWLFEELDWRRWRRFQPAAWRRYQRVQVFTARDADAIRKLAPEVADRVRVNPFGLIMPPVSDQGREVPGMILFVGNFTHAPNRDAAIWLAREILPLVKLRRNDARLRIVGTAPTAEIHRLASADVKVIADAPSVQPYLEAAAVFAAPLRIGGGMRMKVLQALASGKAVVTTTRGTDGFAEEHRPLPLLVADDAQSMANAIADLLEDDARRARLGRSAREFAEAHHSPSVWRTRLEQMYHETVNRPLRVLMATPRNPLGQGGVERHVLEVSSRLAGKGASVEVVCSEPGGAPLAEQRQRGVVIRSLRAWPANRDWCFAPGLWQELARAHWDLIHVQSYHTFVAPLAMLRALTLGVPYCVTFHGGGHSSTLRNRVRGLQLLMLRPLLRRAERLVAVARFEIDFYGRVLRLPREDFVLIPNGTDLELGDLTPIVGSDDRPVLASIGRLERYKGHDRVIAALPHVLEHRSEASLRIVGAGPDEGRLRAFARKLGVADQVRFESVPAGDRRAMAKLLSRLSLVVLMSEFETHPLVALEAAAAGRRLLVADSAGLRELARDGLARAVPLEIDPEALARVIVEELGKPPPVERPRLSTWDECADRLLELYREILRA
jgi:glycosyltransferase involved in cell wall biosynthesis